MKKLILALTVCLLPSTLLAQPSSKQLDNLTKLADYLDEKVSPQHFDIQNWGNTPNPDDPNYVGCAAGYSTKLFASEGVHYKNCDGRYHIAFNNQESQEALQEFFGLTFLETSFLFSNNGGADRNPHKAAANIRTIVNKYKIQQYQALTMVKL